MSKKIMKRSLALGALMAFVITGSVWAADYDAANGPYSNQTVESDANHTYGAFSQDGTVTVNGATFESNQTVQTGDHVSYGGAMFVVGNLKIDNSNFIDNTVYGKTSNAVHGGAVAQENGKLEISGSTFNGNKVLNPTNKDGSVSLDSYGAAIYSGGSGEVYIESSVFENQDGGRAIYIKAGDGTKIATFKDNKFLNNKRGSVQAENANTILNFEGKNEFKDNVDPTGVKAETLFNKGTTNFKSNSETIFSGNQLDIVNNRIVNIEESATVTLGTGITGSGTVNVDGILTGRVFAERGASQVVLNNGGTWNVTDDSTVAKVVVNGNSTIDGTIGLGSNGAKPVLTANKEINNTSEYFIKHNSGDLTINNLKIDGIIKETETGSSKGSVISGYGGSGVNLVITNSEISNNISRRSAAGSSNHYAIIDSYSNTTINNTEFKNNTTNYMGGVLYLHGKVSTIDNSKFISNTASQGAALQSNGAKITFSGNLFQDNIATKDDDGDCGGAICAEGASELTFVGKNNVFDANKATGTNGNGGAIAQYHGSKTINTIVFAKGSYTEFKNNTANNNGGAIWNGSGGVIEVNGDLVFDGNTAGKKGNDIYNKSALKFLGGNTKVSGGIVSEGANAYVEVSNDAVLELNGGTTSLNKLQGNGGIIHFANADAKLSVETNENKTLKFTANGAVNEAVAGDANKLISQVAWADDTTMVMEAGDIIGEVSAKLVKNETTNKLMVEEGSVTEKVNPSNEAISDTAIGMKLHWRAHVNDMNKRMGELRDANGEHGVWTRMVRGESEYKNTKAQYNQYQLGYDEKLSVDKRWTVGAAVTFSEGDASYGYGSTEDKSTAFAIYGSKLNNDGTFVDLIARYAHLESDVDDQAGKGSYSANGMSVSAEFGKRIQQGNGLWIEPQAELTYGTVDGAEYKLGTKIVQVGDIDSLIGRIGFSLGKDIKQGNVYARASYLYDFDGETETAFSNASATRTFKDDLGGGWWEVGVGANINLSKATYVYADVEKTFGGEVDTNWQWNLGVRYSF